MSSACTIYGGCPKCISSQFAIVSNLLYNSSNIGLLDRCIRHINLQNNIHQLKQPWASEKQEHLTLFVCLFVFGATAPNGPGPPHYRGFQITHDDVPQSVGLLWTSDQLVAETSTWQHTQYSQQTNVRVPGGIRTHILSRRAAADLRVRPRGHWDRLTPCCISLNVIFSVTCSRLQ